VAISIIIISSPRALPRFLEYVFIPFVRINSVGEVFSINTRSQLLVHYSTMPSPNNNPFNNPFNNPYTAFFESQNVSLAGLGKPIHVDPNFASRPLVGHLKPTTLKGHVESVVKSLRQGNPRDGDLQIASRHSGSLGETVGTCGYDPTKGLVGSIGHGSKDWQVKYREASDHSALFVERKVHTPLGTGYCEAGGKYSNGIIGFFVNLAFR